MSSACSLASAIIVELEQAARAGFGPSRHMMVKITATARMK
jgi:hypothetical protein